MTLVHGPMPLIEFEKHLTSNTGSQTWTIPLPDYELPSDEMLLIAHFSAAVQVEDFWNVVPHPLIEIANYQVSMGSAGWTQLGETQYVLQDTGWYSSLKVNAVWFRVVSRNDFLAIGMKINFNPNFRRMEEVLVDGAYVEFHGCNPLVNVMAIFPPRRIYTHQVYQWNGYGDPPLASLPPHTGIWMIFYTSIGVFPGTPFIDDDLYSEWLGDYYKGFSPLYSSWDPDVFQTPVMGTYISQDVYDTVGITLPFFQEYVAATLFVIDFYDEVDDGGWTVGSVG